MMDKILIVDRTPKPVWFPRKLKEAWNKGVRGFILNSMGTDHFPVATAKRIGFKVRALPDYCSEEVAGHAFKLLQDLVISVRYDRAIYFQTCLVVGSEGQIGKQVCALAEEKEMTVLKHDLTLKQSNKQLLINLGRAKIVFLCLPLTKETKYFFNTDTFKACKRMSPFIVNVSGRNDLVNTYALLTALRKNLVSGYAIDEEQSYLLNRNIKVVWTPHVGWKSKQSIKKREIFLVSLRVEMEIELNAGL